MANKAHPLAVCQNTQLACVSWQAETLVHNLHENGQKTGIGIKL